MKKVIGFCTLMVMLISCGKNKDEGSPIGGIPNPGAQVTVANILGGYCAAVSGVWVGFDVNIPKIEVEINPLTPDQISVVMTGQDGTIFEYSAFEKSKYPNEMYQYERSANPNDNHIVLTLEGAGNENIAPDPVDNTPSILWMSGFSCPNLVMTKQ